ncbi:MAG: glycosyltransferase family 39 protein [Verrucomicrobiota bacterium]|nr:glycosyltransferase family 39 protein [Verrucomicrobiota bacterium]
MTNDITELAPKRRVAHRLLAQASLYFAMPNRAELVAAILLFLLMVLFKAVNATRYFFNTDESQHLHVVWGWANGFIQYRDVCDNHMPLFQLVFAPIYKLIGERADILYWMRFILMPMYFVAAWCTYRIGAVCFSRRVGLWAVIIAGSYPGYHFCSLEFRTDNLWAPLWLLSVVILVSGAISVRRAVGAGLVLGFCFGISLKSTLLLLSLLTSGALTLLFARRQRLGVSNRYLAACVGAFLISTAIVPAVIVGAFAFSPIWPQFRYWVFENNIVPGLTNHPAWWIWIFPSVFPIVIYVGRAIIRATTDERLAFRRGFIFFICGFYLPALWSFWPLVSRQDYLPYHPLAFVLYTGLLVAVAEPLAARSRNFGRLSAPLALPAFVVLVEMIAMLTLHPFWIDGAQSETDLLRATLQLTKPGDFILDEKGETVFRQRAFPPIWEPCVLRRIALGLMTDDAADRCIRTKTCVAVLGKDMSRDATRFIARNYLPVGHRLRVAGCWLPPLQNHGRADFDVVIPASYEILARNGAIAGTLDGKPYVGACDLAPGRHTFVETADATELVVLWAQAADRHFTPFAFARSTPQS